MKKKMKKFLYKLLALDGKRDLLQEEEDRAGN
jgi:hypothetical protein